MKKLIAYSLFFTIFLTSCSSNESKNTNNLVNNNSNQASIESTDDNYKHKNIKENSNDTNKSKNTKESSNNSSNEKTSVDTSNDKSSHSPNSATDENIKEKIIDYIINGQENKSEAQKIKWSKSFLNQVDIESLYKQYIKSGGNSKNLEKFAEYITLNAPIANNWKKLFEQDLYDKYGEKVVRLEHLHDDLYQAYIENDGKEVPYVVVSSRTGYFHG
ncbi:hypothetical protein [Clostridium weizhouense]|uniref:Lipoprotein n=1 Tax=Clostridium weizhouense TaxID=2859781 RepID=A0ABS7AUA4_9CLOT|nr:hypothetical protein [Clostridium weizhouense]MBW6411195.1 hypothetical protein [Clostridium weizhouense]